MISAKYILFFTLLSAFANTNPSYYGANEECREDQIKYNGKCYCPQGYFSIDGHCSKCPPGQKVDPTTLRCVSFCQKNAYFVQGQCRCIDKFYMIDGVCQTCPKNTYYSSSRGQCVPLCSQNEIETTEGCICQVGFYRINDKCQKCPKTSIFSEKISDCVCPSGEAWSTVINECVKKCGVNEVLLDGCCECKKDHYIIEGRCGICPLPGQYYPRTQQCFCPFGFNYKNGQCLPQCSSREYFDSKKSKCVPYCEQFTEVWKNSKCQCAEGFYRDAKSGICYPSCGPFEIRIQGVCQCIDGYHKGVFGPCVRISCPPGTRWDSRRRQCRSVCAGINQMMVNGVCVCVNGYARQDTGGLCLPKCQNGKVRKNGVCQCPGGNKLVDGQCTNCPKYTQYINGVCLCYNGKLPYNGRCQFLSCSDKNHVFDPILNSCKCRKPLIWMLGKCQYMEECGSHEKWNGKACQCKYGYVKINEKCISVDEYVPQCPANSAFNGLNCQCLPEYYPISPGKCDKCPSNYHWNGFKCQRGDYTCASDYFWDLAKDRCVPINQCGKNEYFDGLNCRCIKGYFWINAQCQKCQYGTFFDGLQCIDQIIPDCEDSYKFWNGKQCACIDGFFQIGDTCVQCPEYSYWNGVCCKPKFGVKVDLTVAGY